MSTDDFENKLKALAGTTTRSDPTAAWKADILARARQEAVTSPSDGASPPRWLMVLWGAAWLVIVLMYVTTPPAEVATAGNVVQTARLKPSTPEATPVVLFAFHRDINSYLELP